jgi:hypothetical protein
MGAFTLINLKAKNEEQLERTIQRCRERNIIIPTFAQLKNPENVPQKIKERTSG